MTAEMWARLMQWCAEQSIAAKHRRPMEALHGSPDEVVRLAGYRDAMRDVAMEMARMQREVSA